MRVHIISRYFRILIQEAIVCRVSGRDGLMQDEDRGVSEPGACKEQRM